MHVMFMSPVGIIILYDNLIRDSSRTEEFGMNLLCLHLCNTCICSVCVSLVS